MRHFRKEHPKLPVIIVEDALSAEGPHIQMLKEHHARFILSVKPGKQVTLFKQFEQAEQDGDVEVLTLVDPDGTLHHYRWLSDAALNKKYAQERVGMLEYWEIGRQETRHFSWITDLELNEQTVPIVARGGRARWKIENETFNTLKNRGYAFEHNFGHGKNHLGTLFAIIMMLVFLIDQAQEIGDILFQSLWQKMGSKQRLWKRILSLFECFRFKSFRQLHETLLNFEAVPLPVPALNSS